MEGSFKVGEDARFTGERNNKISITGDLDPGTIAYVKDVGSVDQVVFVNNIPNDDGTRFTEIMKQFGAPDLNCGFGSDGSPDSNVPLPLFSSDIEDAFVYNVDESGVHVAITSKDGGIDGTIIVAVYSEGGRKSLIDYDSLEIHKADFIDNVYTKTFTGLQEGTLIKVMFWENLVQVVPVFGLATEI